MAASASPVELSAPTGTMKDVDLEEGGNDSGINEGVTAAEAPPDVEGQEALPRSNSYQGEDVEAGMPRAGSWHRPPSGTLGDVMAGVGEDQKPYNYICNLDKVNLGGPGWFNDVFKISIEVDSDRTFLDTLTMSLVPRHIFQRHCKLINTSQRVTGTVTVESPPDKRVWMAGVTVTFEEHLITVDSDGGELVGALEAQVALGQYVTGKATFDFDLDLRLLESHRRWPVRETYVGQLMALRHRILVGAQRPWYTFNVYHEVPIAMERLSIAPEEDAGQENEEGGPNHVLVISDCNGRCEFDFGVDSFNMGDTLTGAVRFMDIASPIVAAHVMVLKAEFMYGEASEVLVAEHTILGERRGDTDYSAESGLSEQERLRMQFMSPFVAHKDVHYVHSQEDGCRKEAVIGDAEISVHLPLEPLPLTPTHMSLTQDISSVTDESELVGVRYYIRLIVEDNSRAAFWHTHEIFFHRSKPSLSSSLALDDGADDSDREEPDDVIDNGNGVTMTEDNSGVTVDGETVNSGVTVPVDGGIEADARGTANGNMASKVSSGEGGDVR